MKLLYVIVFGVLEFLGFSLILSYSFTQFRNSNNSILPCLALIIFLLWIGKKVSNMSEVSQGGNHGE